MLAINRAFEMSFARCLSCKLIVSTTDSISSTSTNSFGLNALSLNNIINDVRLCMNPTLVTFGATDSKSNKGIFNLNDCVCAPLETAGNNALNKPSSSFPSSASKHTYEVVTYISPFPLAFGNNALHLIGPFVTFSDGASSKSSHAPPSSTDAFASSAESFALVFHPRTTAWTFLNALIICCSAITSDLSVCCEDSMECDRLDVIIPAAALVPSVSVDIDGITPSNALTSSSFFVVKFASFPRSSFSVLPVVVLPPTADFDRDFDRFFLFFPIILNVSSINNDKTGAARADFQTRREILRVVCVFLRVVV